MYVKTVWITGDVVTAAKANNVETQYDAVFDSTPKTFVGSVGVGPADRISLSGRSVTDTYYVAANYVNENGSESVTASGRGSWRIAMRTVTSTSFTIDWRDASAGAGTFTNTLTLGSNGQLTVQGGLIVQGSHLQIASSSLALYWGSSTTLEAPANGHLRMTTFAGTEGVRFKVTTDARLEVRNRADGAYADIYGKDVVLSGELDVSGIASFSSGVDISGGVVVGGNNGQSDTFDPNSITSMQFQDGVLIAHS